MSQQPNHYSVRERVLPCEECGEPVSVPLEGGAASCGACGRSFPVGPRPDTSVPRGSAVDESTRLEHLRRQAGQSMVPPPELQGLFKDGGIEPWKLAETREVWKQTRRRLLADPSDLGASERLMFLTIAFANACTDPKDDRLMRALLEAALEAFSLPRHRQFMRGYLARRAARSGDLESAEVWLSGCDPASDDLVSDSSWRLSLAMVGTARGDFPAVLAALGKSGEGVVIHDSMDSMAAVLRANACERLGDPDGARAVLSALVSARGVGALDTILHGMPAEWGLCAQSLEAVRADHRRKVAERAGSDAWMGWVGIGAGFLPVLIGVPAILLSDTPRWVIVFLPLVAVLVGGWGVKIVRRARRGRLIARSGEHGRGRILSVEQTGTTINDVPLMRIAVEVAVPGRQPVRASTTRLVQPHVADAMVGREVGVMWHSSYPADVVIED